MESHVYGREGLVSSGLTWPRWELSEKGTGGKLACHRCYYGLLEFDVEYCPIVADLRKAEHDVFGDGVKR